MSILPLGAKAAVRVARELGGDRSMGLSFWVKKAGKAFPLAEFRIPGDPRLS